MWGRHKARPVDGEFMTASDRFFDFPYVYRWANKGRQGQRCRVLVVGTLYACLVEFPDGFKMVSTVNALKEAEIPSPTTPSKTATTMLSPG